MSGTKHYKAAPHTALFPQLPPLQRAASQTCLPSHTHRGKKKKCHTIGKVRASQGNRQGERHSRTILPQARAWPEGRPRTCLRCQARGASPIPSSTFSSLSEWAAVGGVKPNMSFFKGQSFWKGLSSAARQAEPQQGLEGDQAFC